MFYVIDLSFLMSRQYRLNAVELAAAVTRPIPNYSLLTVVRAQRMPFSSTEALLEKRLKAAWTLRGTHVTVVGNISVNYEALAELSFYRVITPRGTRCWGQPVDVRVLAESLQNYFSLGIIMLDHRLKVAFHFRPNDGVELLTIYQGLKYAARFNKCLLMARVSVKKCYVNFARVEAKLIRKQYSWNRVSIKDIILTHAVCGPPFEPSQDTMSR